MHTFAIRKVTYRFHDSFNVASFVSTKTNAEGLFLSCGLLVDKPKKKPRIVKSSTREALHLNAKAKSAAVSQVAVEILFDTGLVDAPQNPLLIDYDASFAGKEYSESVRCDQVAVRARPAKCVEGSFPVRVSTFSGSTLLTIPAADASWPVEKVIDLLNKTRKLESPSECYVLSCSNHFLHSSLGDGFVLKSGLGGESAMELIAIVTWKTKLFFKHAKVKGGKRTVWSIRGRRSAGFPPWVQSAKEESAQEQEVLRAFRSWDRDSSGSIEAAELKEALGALGLSNANASAIFAAADVNRDGCVDYGEFVSWLFDSSPSDLRELYVREPQEEALEDMRDWDGDYCPECRCAPLEGPYTPAEGEEEGLPPSVEYYCSRCHILIVKGCQVKDAKDSASGNQSDSEEYCELVRLP
eukprot:TRINITY_DN60847_c0_g1_i1.p1 TRINITY_DN60847_c0_g1~~TRINITY_DN60847_c0_g1_i1.p1  ORF type:complete len:453 (+),score=96.52 TRINITY_DN60847_c0_g1_i1:129-1361(+)